jgi:segregation and condensation protein A
MLLPRKPLDEQGNEIDPREELVARLLEYKRYKSVLDEMRDLEEQRAVKEIRGNVATELQQLANRALADSELESLSLFRLLRAFENVMGRFEKGPPQTVHQIVRFNYSIEDQQLLILSKVAAGKSIDFTGIFGECKDRIHAIITFLALLDLLNMEKIAIVQGIGVNNFWLEAPNTEEE